MKWSSFFFLVLQVIITAITVMSKHSKRTGTEKEISDKLFLFIKQWIRSLEGFREGSYAMLTIKLHQLGMSSRQTVQASHIYSICIQGFEKGRKGWNILSYLHLNICWCISLSIFSQNKMEWQLSRKECVKTHQSQLTGYIILLHSKKIWALQIPWKGKSLQEIYYTKTLLILNLVPP